MGEPVFIQFLSSLPILNYFADFYYQVMIPQADMRTATWALMSSPDVPVSIVLLYLFTVLVIAPFLLRYIKIPQVNKILILYNSFVLTLNLWLGISLIWHISKAGYELGCQKVSSYGVHENAIASLLWVFHCSKIIELVDTLFLVLKRKENQLTFLHLYHHSTIVFATWMGVRFVPGGSSGIIATINSWIHVFMYFYYEMMALRIKTFRNYKKIVTILQIVQFMATIVHCTTALKRECGYPRWLLIWLMLYMISFLVLFIHFYVQTYWKPKGGKEDTAEISSLSSSTSSTSSSSVSSSVPPPPYSEDEEEEESEGNQGNKERQDSIVSANGQSSDTSGDFDFVQWENEEEEGEGEEAISSDENENPVNKSEGEDDEDDSSDDEEEEEEA